MRGSDVRWPNSYVARIRAFNDTMSDALQRVTDHLRSIRTRANAASMARDFEGLRAVIGEYHAVSRETATVIGDVGAVDANGVSAEWITTPESDPNRRLLYIHGGSWIAGGFPGYRPLAGRIAAAAQCAVLLIEYRLAPEHPFPAGLDDCITAYQWMRKHSPNGSANASQCFIAGDSAGGNLTLAGLLALRDRGIPLPDAAVAISPATDLTGSGQSTVTRAEVDPIIDGARVAATASVYCKGYDLKVPLISPLFGDLHGLPRLLVQVGDAETLLDDSRRFAAKAETAGVEVTLEVWPAMPHVWHVFAPVLQESNDAIEHLGAFLRR